ncbi:MAG: MetQ/NlpA family ABC transporter substrate-binding protein [Chloroflexi bacterium]|nr:MetQ/NlpA family ABC transporter substrate-binding protein [Chloroflexota bacterium]
MMKRLVLLIILVAASLAACTPAPAQTTILRIGVLPILEALPMYVAQSQGYFAEEGLQVEFVPAASAAERDQLMQANQIDGMINDLVAVLLYNRDQVQIVVVRFARTASAEDPNYRILASGQSGITSVDGLRGVPIGVSEGTVIEYVTDRLLQAEGLKAEEIEIVAVPKIPDRLALLESGEIQAATLPDPLSSLALQAGATLIIDDTSHPEYGTSVLSFRKEIIDQSPDALRGFLCALQKATAEVNADPGQWSMLLTENSLVPAPLIGSYQLPEFPSASVPSEAQYADALDWAITRGLLTGSAGYADAVDGSFLP